MGQIHGTFPPLNSMRCMCWTAFKKVPTNPSPWRLFAQVLKLLKARGQVNVVFESGAASTSSKRRLTFAGFVGVTPSTQDERVLLGQRASWEPGASAPVRLPIRKPGANVETGNSTIPPAEKKTWKLAIDGDDDGGVFGAGADSDDDLVDEDALLESSAPVKRTNQVGDWATASCSHM